MAFSPRSKNKKNSPYVTKFSWGTDLQKKSNTGKNVASWCINNLDRWREAATALYALWSERVSFPQTGPFIESRIQSQYCYDCSGIQSFVNLHWSDEQFLGKLHLNGHNMRLTGGAMRNSRCKSDVNFNAIST